MRRPSHLKPVLAVLAMMSMLLICWAAHAQPMSTTQPAMTTTMVPATAPAMQPAPRPVVRRPAARPAPRPAARPAAMPAAAPAMPAEMAPEAMEAPAPAEAMEAAMAAAKAAEQPSMAAAPEGKKDAKKDSVGKVILGGALEILIYLIGVFLAALTSVLVPYILKKLKIHSTEAAQQVDAIVDKAILFGLNYAEEQAHKLRDNPVDSAKKLDLAVGKAKEYIKDSGLPEKGSEYLAALIEAKLGEKRADEPKPEKKEDEKKDDEKEGDKE